MSRIVVIWHLTALLFGWQLIEPAQAQLLRKKTEFSRADTLRGYLGPERSCYDVTYYHLDITIDPDRKFLSGSNTFSFVAVTGFKRLQFDLFANMEVEKVTWNGKELRFSREFNAVFVDFPEKVEAGTQSSFTVHYRGNPVVARNPPWDGGFVFSRDAGGKHWVGVACQGTGASLWWPNKDHQSDRADSVLISVAVPDGLMNVSNGRLRSVGKANGGYRTFHWFVSYPINNYNVTVNIGDYSHLKSGYQGERGRLDLDYYVLKENQAKAAAHFEPDVQQLLRCFEGWFGPYPFYRDGYKLVETPYLGMEHQSAIAYGNQYRKGYLGTDLSGTGYGSSWDFIIVHESGHEWFGNQVSSSDIADMWIHEAFTTYSEGLFVENREGKEAGVAYIKGLRGAVKNDRPVIGSYHVNHEGSGDMYFKGANLVQTIRTALDNDSLFREILHGLNRRFAFVPTTTEEVVTYINETGGRDFTAVFNQYLRYTRIPELVFGKDGSGQRTCYWRADEKGFDLPVRVRLPGKKWQFIYPTTVPQALPIAADTAIEVDTDGMYINVRK